MKAKSLLGIVALLLLFSLPAHAAQYQYAYGNENSYSNVLGKILRHEQLTDDDLDNFLGLSNENLTKFALYASGPAGYQKLLTAVENARLDKQAGAAPSSEGTTSLVSKGVATQLLSLAVEQGALSRSDNKAISTFTGSALGIGRFLFGANKLPYCAVFDLGCESPLERALDGLTFNLSFDTSPGSNASMSAAAGSSNAAVLRGPSPAFSGATLRYDFHVRRQVAPADFVAQMTTLQATAYGQATSNILSPVLVNPGYVEWKDKAGQDLVAHPPADAAALKGFLAGILPGLVAVVEKAVPDFAKANGDFLTAMGTYFGQRDKALEAFVNRVTFSGELDYEHPLNQPEQLTPRFIVSARLDDSGKHQFSFNSSASWYVQAPPQNAVRRFRDAQASLQLDFALNEATSNMGAEFSVGYYFQWMADNALLTIPSGNLAPGTSISLPGDASVLLGTKGTISIGQIALTLSFKNGIKFPITLSYANRTDLLTAGTLRGHFGLSYDLDSALTGLIGK